MKGKILYLGGFILPDGNAAAHRVVGNAKVFESLGYDVVFVGVNSEKLRFKFDSFGFRSYDVKYPSNVFEWISFVSSIDTVKSIIEKEKPTAIILYNYPSIQTFRLIKLCRTQNIDIYGDITEWYQPKGFSISSIVKRVDTFFRMRVLNFKLTGLIVISDYLYNFYKKSVNRIIKVPPLINSDLAIWEKLVEKEERCINFVYAGSPGIGGKDELGQVVKFFFLAKEKYDFPSTLRIVGLTKNQYRETFGGEERYLEDVHFLGRITHYSSLENIKKAHFSVFFRKPTLVNNAGFPTKFVEAISLGTPVITNATSDLKNYFISYPNKLGILVYDFDQDNAIVEGFIKAFESVKNRSYFEMSEFCRENRFFRYEEYVDTFKEIF